MSERSARARRGAEGRRGVRPSASHPPECRRLNMDQRLSTMDRLGEPLFTDRMIDGYPEPSPCSPPSAGRQRRRVLRLLDLRDAGPRSSDRSRGIAACRRSASEAPTPVFMTALMGTGAALRGGGRRRGCEPRQPWAPYLLVGGLLYLAGIALHDDLPRAPQRRSSSARPRPAPPRQAVVALPQVVDGAEPRPNGHEPRQCGRVLPRPAPRSELGLEVAPDWLVSTWLHQARGSTSQDRLSAATIDDHRALVSLMENSRPSTGAPGAKQRRAPSSPGSWSTTATRRRSTLRWCSVASACGRLDEHLRTYLFTSGSILRLEAQAERLAGPLRATAQLGVTCRSTTPQNHVS